MPFRQERISQSPCVIPPCYHQEASVRTSKHNIHYMVKSIWATPLNPHFRCFQSHWCMKSITEPRRLPLQTFVNEWFEWAPWISGWYCNRIAIGNRSAHEISSLQDIPRSVVCGIIGKQQLSHEASDCEVAEHQHGNCAPGASWLGFPLPSRSCGCDV